MATREGYTSKSMPVDGWQLHGRGAAPMLMTWRSLRYRPRACYAILDDALSLPTA